MEQQEDKQNIQTSIRKHKRDVDPINTTALKIIDGTADPTPKKLKTTTPLTHPTVPSDTIVTFIPLVSAGPSSHKPIPTR